MPQGSGSEAAQAPAAASGHATTGLDVVVALAGVLPLLILVIAGCWLVVRNWPWITDQLIPRLSTVKVMGVEVSFVKGVVDDAMAHREHVPKGLKTGSRSRSGPR
jgi:hypothetical protein